MRGMWLVSHSHNPNVATWQFLGILQSQALKRQSLLFERPSHLFLINNPWQVFFFVCIQARNGTKM